MKDFKFAEYLKSNILLNEEQHATFKNDKIFISKPKDSAMIKGTRLGTKELIYTLEKLQSIYNISNEDMQTLSGIINKVLK